MRDFSLNIYRSMLEAFIQSGYTIFTFEKYIESANNNNRLLILRHDVDKKPSNSLAKAIIENKLGVSSTYYFRVIGSSYNEKIIQEIKELGHEIGYHYEDLTLARGNKEKAINLFETNLKLLRRLYPVSTICMHGSPMSKWNNLDIWQNYNFRTFDIIGEPNFDIDFTEVFYLTDTGMAWNKDKYAVRDISRGNFDITIKKTNDIIAALNNRKLPNMVMINTHPQRWSNNIMEWAWEKFSQTLKNQIKRLVKNRIKGINNVN